MRKIMMAAAALCCMTVMTVTTTSCTNKNNQTATSEENTETAAIVINLDSIVINPYVQFGSSLDDVQKYMAGNFADYSDQNPDSLVHIEIDGGTLWSKCYKKGKREISFFFVDADGKDFTMVSYDFFFSMPLETVMAELERNGFTNKGEIRFDSYNPDITYLFLSPDESIEAMPSYWEKDGGSWAISFQPINDFDLQHLIEN